MPEQVRASTPSATLGKIGVVACSYAMPPTELRDRLCHLSRRLGVTLQGVVVCNGPHPLGDACPDWQFVRGDNADLDFSAYMQGARFWLSRMPAVPRVIVFVNDSLFTFHEPAANLSSLLHLVPLLGVTALPALAGKADPYTTICHRNPWSDLDLYVSSYCFAVNHLALDAIPRLAEWADADGLDHTIDVMASHWGASLHPVFREFLRANIVHGVSPYRWHGWDKHAHDATLLRKKARCIYFEHRLSGYIGRNGCILPTNAGPRAKSKLYMAETVSRLLRRLRLAR